MPEVRNVPIRFRGLMQSVGECVLPLDYASDMGNVDLDEDGSASRRKGMQRALDSAMSGKVSMVLGFDDYDGGDGFLVVDSTGIRRET